MAKCQQAVMNSSNNAVKESNPVLDFFLGCSIAGAAAAVMHQTSDQGEHQGGFSEIFLVISVVCGVGLFRRSRSSRFSYKRKKIIEDDEEHDVAEACPEEVVVAPLDSASCVEEETNETIAPTLEADQEDLDELASLHQVDDISRDIVASIRNLGDLGRLEYFFQRMQLSGLDPSIMFHNKLMNVCERTWNSYESEQFLERMLHLGAKAKDLTDAFSGVVESCAEANDLMFSHKIEESYSALVHASNLMEN